LSRFCKIGRENFTARLQIPGGVATKYAKVGAAHEVATTGLPTSLAE
jgi:hypothetical protein